MDLMVTYSCNYKSNISVIKKYFIAGFNIICNSFIVDRKNIWIINLISSFKYNLLTFFYFNRIWYITYSYLRALQVN